jgi:hypothetical protein
MMNQRQGALGQSMGQQMGREEQLLLLRQWLDRQRMMGVGQGPAQRYGVSYDPARIPQGETGLAQELIRQMMPGQLAGQLPGLGINMPHYAGLIGALMPNLFGFLNRGQQQ